MKTQMIKKLSTIGILGWIASLSFTAPATALSWTGDANYYLTGSFSFNNINLDDFVRSSDNELTSFQVSFYDNKNNLLDSYNLTQLLVEQNFNFNYQISTAQILQTGAANALDGFSIGKNPNGASGYVLETSGGAIYLTDVANNFPLDNNGTLTATTVPFHINSNLHLTVFGCFWVINIMYRKKLLTRKNNTSIDQ
ncbi:hypothetical protein NIES4074_37940 [Cylindrospermum sp. NIES-4074]|nr:hypothetical protein NIES4074_37940 [Cylindrospermum sp. NIES-4074]